MSVCVCVGGGGGGGGGGGEQLGNNSPVYYSVSHPYSSHALWLLYITNILYDSNWNSISFCKPTFKALA